MDFHTLASPTADYDIAPHTSTTSSSAQRHGMACSIKSGITFLKRLSAYVILTHTFFDDIVGNTVQTGCAALAYQ